MTASVTPPSWSSDEPHQSDRISRRVLLQDLSRQGSFLALIIITKSLQVYQQTRTLGYSDSRTKRQGFLWKKRKKDHGTPLHKELHWLPVKFCASIRSWLWPTPTSKGLYLHIFLHPSALTNHLVLSNLQKLLKIPQGNQKYFGEHSFSFMALSAWNSQAAYLRNLPPLSKFKSNFKTLLFTKAFP